MSRICEQKKLKYHWFCLCQNMCSVLPKMQVAAAPKQNGMVVKKSGDKLVAPVEKKVILNLMKPKSILVPLTPGFDIRSQMGQFGWTTLGGVHLPYIFRTGKSKDRFISVRIVNQKVLAHYCLIFNQALFDRFIMDSFTMTEHERRLYNEINMNHANAAFGLNPFKAREQLVRLHDVNVFLEFLRFCYLKLVLNDPRLDNMCGYMQFNKNGNPVPYIIIDGEECLVTYYFEGDVGILEGKSKTIDKFSEAVLKFLMVLQRVNEVPIMIRVITLRQATVHLDCSDGIRKCWPEELSGIFTGPLKSESILKVQNADDPTEMALIAQSEQMKTMGMLQLVHGNERIAVYKSEQ